MLASAPCSFGILKMSIQDGFFFLKDTGKVNRGVIYF